MAWVCCQTGCGNVRNDNDKTCSGEGTFKAHVEHKKCANCKPPHSE